MAKISILLPAATKMVVTADANSSGNVYSLPEPGGGEPGPLVAVAASGTLTVGPFAAPSAYMVNSLVGALSVALSPAATQAAVANVAAITSLAPPAGGTGATAGAYDTAVNRDAMITSLTAVRTDHAATRTTVNNILTALRAYGIILP
jgi:hypothetical protein